MKEFIKKYLLLSGGIVLFTIVTVYWIFIASDKYISSANVVVDSPQIVSQEFNVGSLLTGAGGGDDLLILRDYLLSVDMMQSLERDLNIREHYENESIDFVSRLNKKSKLEEFHKYYLKQISVELDSYSNVLRLKISAFSPEMAYQVNKYLLENGEDYINKLGKRLAEEQVDFLANQVSELKVDLEKSRENLLIMQNELGLYSPIIAIENKESVIRQLEINKAELETDKLIELTYQSPHSSKVKRISNQIKSIEKQLNIEKSKLVTNNSLGLNKLHSDFKNIQMKLEFSEDAYKTALKALETTRIEASRKLKKVSMLQTPTIPEYSSKPERVHNVAISFVVIFLIVLIIYMFLMIVKEHKD